jgi:hypothetical protein
LMGLQGAELKLWQFCNKGNGWQFGQILL